ncbi:TPA: hypothetical protein ACH3X3_006895 [Trebouxia sp. C0006]
MADAQGSVQSRVSHVPSCAPGSVNTRADVSCHVERRVAGCPVTRGAPRSCHVGTSARASAVNSALHISSASSVGTPPSRLMMLC